MEGKYTHLIDIVSQYTERGNVSGKVEQITKALEGTEKITPKLSTQMESVATAMQGIIPPEMQGKLEGVFKTFEEGSKVTQLSTRQVDLLKDSLFKAGASKDQVGAITKNLQEMGVVTKSSSGAMGDFERAMRRALIVAPIWMLTREIIKQVTNFVKEGIQYYLETEKAILNVRSAIEEMGQSGGSTISELTDRFRSLSAETGKTTASIANVYASINRILGNTEQSYLATNAAVKLSEATGVDAAKIAETLAFMYKLQGDSLKGVTTDTQKFQEISALLYATQAKTPGGLEKLITDIRNFAATMNLADFGIENTVKLFGALESAGVSSSQVLRTGVMKVLTNMNEVSKMLGITLSDNITPFEAFILVLEKLGANLKPDKLNVNTFAVIKDIFGQGARGAGQVAALAKDIGALKSALAGGGVSERDRYLYQKQLDDVNDSAQHQIEIFGNLKKQAGEAFITGIMGGEDFATAIKNANNLMNESIRVAQNLGIEFNVVAKAINIILSLGTSSFTDAAKKRVQAAKDEYDLQTRIQMALKGQLTLQEVNALAGEVSVSNLIKEEGLRQRVLDALQQQSIAEAKTGIESAKNKEIEEGRLALAKEIQKEIEKQIGYASSILSIAGEQESSIIRQEMAFRAMTEGESYLKDTMKDRLRLAQALTKEADEQEKSSSRLVELYKIAKKYGKDTAQEVSDYLAGIKKFGELSPRATTALRRVTPAEFERGTAEEYFRGKGFQFPEQIERERIRQRNIQILQNVMVEPIQLNVNLESENLIQRIKDEINKEVDKIGSKLNTSVQQQIKGY